MEHYINSSIARKCWDLAVMYPDPLALGNVQRKNKKE